MLMAMHWTNYAYAYISHYNVCICTGRHSRHFAWLLFCYSAMRNSHSSVVLCQTAHFWNARNEASSTQQQQQPPSLQHDLANIGLLCARLRAIGIITLFTLHILVWIAHSHISSYNTCILYFPLQVEPFSSLVFISVILFIYFFFSFFP